MVQDSCMVLSQCNSQAHEAICEDAIFKNIIFVLKHTTPKHDGF